MSNRPIDEIYSWLLPEMQNQRIENTPENRIAALVGVQAIWNQDKSDILKTMHLRLALNDEIFALKIKLLADKLV